MNSILEINPIWITLGPIVVINVVLLISYLTFQLWGRRRLTRKLEGSKNEASSFLSSGTREWWIWTTDPIVRLFVKLRMGPNTITMIGFLFTCVAAYLFAKGWFGYAGWVMIFGATFDMFDGRVARLTNRTSRSGAFFDAVMDRFSEGVCLLGLAYFFRNNFMLPVAIAALMGSQLVSYTRARGEGIGIDCKVGMMQRPERIVYLGVAAVFDPIMGVALSRWWVDPPHLLMMLALCFVAGATVFTAVQRMIYIMNALDNEDRHGRESIPQLITKLTTQQGREELWDRARYGYDRSRAAYSHVILFLTSGIGSGLMREMLGRGDLPNISRHITERGGICDAVGAFPSTRGPAATPFVTGSFPGTCDIPGARWFDRTVNPGRVLAMSRFRDYLGWGAYAMDHDLSKSVRTIFEYSKQAVNLFGVLNRGCGLVRDPSFFKTHRLFSERMSAGEVDRADEASFHWFNEAMMRDTDFVLYRLATALATDRRGEVGESARVALRRMDEHIGRAIEVLKSKGMYDTSAIMLASDHGAGEAKRSFNIEGFIEKRFRGLSGGGSMREWQEADAIVLASGTSMAHLYVKSECSWSARTFFEDVEQRGLVGALLEQEGIDIVAGRSVEGGIVMQSRRGRAHVHEDADGRITYLAKIGDPFGLSCVPQVLEAGRALDVTADSEYPDGILQLLQIFRSVRTGDLVVSAHGDVVLEGAGNSIATHGSLAREHMVVPFLSSVPIGPGVVRTADVFAMALVLMGIEPAHPMDGSVPAGVSAAEGEVAATR